MRIGYHLESVIFDLFFMELYYIGDEFKDFAFYIALKVFIVFLLLFSSRSSTNINLDK